MNGPIIVDTGILLAAANWRDRLHAASVEWLATVTGPLLVPVPVLVETAWQIETNVSSAAEAAFVVSVNRGELRRVDLTDGDWVRVHELIDAYSDLRLGTVDASVIAVAERLGITTLATFNHRDFSVVRPSHCNHFELVPT